MVDKSIDTKMLPGGESNKTIECENCLGLGYIPASGYFLGTECRICSGSGVICVGGHDDD